MSGLGGHGDGHRGARVAENDNGYLEYLQGTGPTCRWVGVRTTPGTTHTETKRFLGEKKEVIERWERWQSRMRGEEASKPAKREVREVAQKVAEKMAMPKVVHVLRYQCGRTFKEMAAYIDENKALDMAVGLNDALKVADQDGEWTVESMELRA